jgi:nucleoid-associated protein YejK
MQGGKDMSRVTDFFIDFADSDIFRPAWKSKKEARAMQAVKNMNNKDKLIRVAMEAYSADVRIYAAEKTEI